jgi:hypothetical protein
MNNQHLFIRKNPVCSGDLTGKISRVGNTPKISPTRNRGLFLRSALQIISFTVYKKIKNRIKIYRGVLKKCPFHNVLFV